MLLVMFGVLVLLMPFCTSLSSGMEKYSLGSGKPGQSACGESLAGTS